MKGMFKTVLFTALISVASVSFAQEVPGSHFEDAIPALQSSETTSRLALLKSQALTLGNAGIAFVKGIFKSAETVAKDGYEYATEYVSENPTKAAVIAVAAVIVPTAVYFAAKKAINYWKNRTK